MTPTKLRDKRATMKPHVLLLIAIAITAFSGCASDATPTPTLVPYVDIHAEYGKPFDLHLTNSALLFADDQPYRLDFTNMVSDSRCAVGNECLRPDVAVIEVTLTNLSSAAGSVTHNLFFDAGPSTTILGPFTVQVLALSPPVEQVTSPSDYVLTLLVISTPVVGRLDVRMTSSTTSAKTGDQVTYTASADGSRLPQYTLTVNGVVVGVLRYDGTLVRGAQTPIIELVAWEAGHSEASWTIKPLGPGSFNLQVLVTGEIVIGNEGEVVFAEGIGTDSLSVD